MQPSDRRAGERSVSPWDELPSHSSCPDLQRGDQVTVQWSDETELRLKLNGKQIRSMLLIANVE